MISQTFRTAGVFESQLTRGIGKLPRGWPGAALAFLPSYHGVDLRVTVAGHDAEHVRAVAAKAREQLLAKVGSVVYAEGHRTMEEVVGETLLARKLRMATAESCTGGLLAKRMTDVAGSSQYFERGYVTYSNESKVALVGVRAADLEAHGAVSAPVAAQLASGARTHAGVDVGVGITGIAGPDGGTPTKPVGTVFIGVSTGQGDDVRSYRFRGGREVVSERSVQTALDLVRRKLLAAARSEPRGMRCDCFSRCSRRPRWCGGRGERYAPAAGRRISWVKGQPPLHAAFSRRARRVGGGPRGAWRGTRRR